MRAEFKSGGEYSVVESTFWDETQALAGKIWERGVFFCQRPWQERGSVVAARGSRNRVAGGKPDALFPDGAARLSLGGLSGLHPEQPLARGLQCVELKTHF